MLKIHGRLSLKSFFFTLLLVLKSPTAANASGRERAAEREATKTTVVDVASVWLRFRHVTALVAASFSGVSDQVQSGAFLKTKKRIFKLALSRAAILLDKISKPPPTLATTLAKSHHARYGQANKNNKYSSSVFRSFYR